MDRNAEHLRLLSIFYYVLGGLTALFSCVFIIHIVMGLFFLVAPNSGHGGAPPKAFGALFALLGFMAVIIGWISAALMVFTGRFLSQRKHYVFCLVIAGLCCLSVPFGTILGVFTIIVIQRPEVKAMFEQKPVVS